MEEITQFEFEEDFEQKLLAFFVRDLKFFNKIPLMKPNYFVSKPRGDIYQKTEEYIKKYGELPSQEYLKNEIQEMYILKKKKDVPIDLYWEVLADLYARDVSVGQQYAEDKVMYFIRGQETANVLKDGAKRIMAGKDLQPILDGITKALAIGKTVPKIRTCDDVDSTIGGESEDWIVRGLIAKNDINLWYAPPGCGKSHLIWGIGNAVNDGKDCLDIEIHQTPVTYIDLENTEDVRRHFKRLLGGGKMGLITLEDEDVSIPNIDSEPQKFEDFIQTLPQGVVVIDTFPMVTGETKFADSKWEVDPLIKTLRRLCAKGYTFVLIFHSLKADPKTIKGPQELLGRCGHVVSIYSVPDVGVTEETEELDTSDPNKPKTLFVGTGPNLKSRHKKYLYWVRVDMNEGNPLEAYGISGYSGKSGWIGTGFRRLSDPNEPVLEKIKAEFTNYLEKKKTEDPNDYYPNQGEFIELITTVLDCSEKQARRYVKLGIGKYWGEKVLPEHTFRYYPIF